MRASTQRATEIKAALRSKISDSKFSPRVWEGSDHARVYTGSRNEHVRVYDDGRVEHSQSRMSWGSEINEVAPETA